jgi:hypothetical protein
MHSTGWFFITATHEITNISGPNKPNGLKFYTPIKLAWHESVTKFYENCLKSDDVIKIWILDYFLISLDFSKKNKLWHHKIKTNSIISKKIFLSDKRGCRQ